MRWAIIPVLAGEFGMVRDDIKFQGGDPKIMGMVPSILYLLQGEDGTKVIVDTGFGALEDVQAMGLVAKREIPFLSLLSESGIVPEEADALLLTHTHWDHAENCGIFSKAQVFCQQQDWDYAFSKAAEYTEKLRDALRTISLRTSLLQGDTSVYPGIRALCFGGHIPGSQCFEVETTEGTVFLCGDDIMTFRNVEEGIPVGLCVDTHSCQRAIRYVREHENVHYLLPSHDYRTLLYVHDKESCRIR